MSGYVKDMYRYYISLLTSSTQQKPVDHHRLTGFLFFLAPAVGLEPTTQWLTATCSAS